MSTNVRIFESDIKSLADIYHFRVVCKVYRILLTEGCSLILQLAIYVGRSHVGTKIGSSVGYNEGEEVTIKSSEGDKEGTQMGCWLGRLLNCSDGYPVGSPLGAQDGTALCAPLASKLGTLLCTEVGMPVGDPLGALAGSADGSPVGVPLGWLYGCPVGSH